MTNKHTKDAKEYAHNVAKRTSEVNYSTALMNTLEQLNLPLDNSIIKLNDVLLHIYAAGAVHGVLQTLDDLSTEMSKCGLDSVVNNMNLNKQ